MERYKEFELSELLTKDGYVVAIEGDNDFEIVEIKKSQENCIICNKETSENENHYDVCEECLAWT